MYVVELNMSFVCFLLAFLVLPVSLLLLGVKTQSRVSSPRKRAQNREIAIYEFEVLLGKNALEKKRESGQAGMEIV